MVGNQTANLIFGPSFGHNLCFKCPNGSCEPILDIWVPKAFEWYKEFFNLMSFDPYHCSLNIQKSIWDSNSQNVSSLGSVKVHSLTLFCTPRSMRCDSRASFLARTLANPCLGHKPKARVATLSWPMVAHNCFLDGDIDVLFGANTRNWSANFAIRLWSTKFSLFEKLEAMIGKFKI